MFRYPERARRFDVLVAVIDKIPYPRGAPLKGKAPDFSKISGFEGVSVTVLRSSKDSAPNLWSAREWKQERETMTVQQRCTLSFLIRPSNKGIAESTGQRDALYSLQLPVANTLFNNGQTSTVFAERWDFSQKSTSKLRGLRTRKAFLPTQVLRLTSFDGDQLRLSTILQPITPPRIVAAAMGNIIRQVYPGSDSNPDGTAPASRELEEVISQNIETSQVPAPKSEIWALIIPRESTVTWPLVWPGHIQTLFENGSRLHKVLSGGGGWGPKEGLLALDPDPDYGNHEHEMEPDFGDGQNIAKEKSSAFDEIVKAGDAVTFFNLRSVDPSYIPEKPSENRSSWDFKIAPSFSLGTIPSKMDEVPDSILGPSGTELPFDYVLIRNHFGMLSEHGMSLKIETHSSDDSGSFDAEPLGTVVRTKIDAPYTVFHQSRPKWVGGAKVVQLVSDTENPLQSEPTPRSAPKLKVKLDAEKEVRIEAQGKIPRQRKAFSKKSSSRLNAMALHQKSQGAGS